MFEKLKSKWGVNNLNLFLILCTFAIGGSLCGYLSRTLLALIGMERGSMIYIIVYIITMTILWPITVITVSIPFGQFSFFKNYLLRIFKKFKGRQ